MSEGESQGDPTLPSRASEAGAPLDLISFLVLVGLFLESQRMASGCKRCLLVHRCLILFIGSKDGWQGLPQRPEEEEHSDDWREGAACPCWTGETPVWVVERVRGAPVVHAVFYLASPDPKTTGPRASPTFSEGPAYQGGIRTGRLKRSF